jgi:probable rRNA maturation factor
MRLTVARATGRRLPPGTRSALVGLAERLRPARLQVQLVLGDDALLRRLNREFRARDRRTDVLSFRYEPGPGGAADGADAEVYVSVPQARRQARERGHGLASEIVLLVLHGLLHVQGHDHHTEPEARRMRRAERAQLARLASRRRGPALRPLLPAIPGGSTRKAR